MKNLPKKARIFAKFFNKFTKYSLVFLVGFFVSSALAADKARISKEGRKTYSKYCISCHLSGASGAPRFKRQKEWESRILQSRETLYKHAIEGFGKMDPKGGFPKLTDEQVKIAVDYILESLPNPPKTP